MHEIEELAYIQKDIQQDCVKFPNAVNCKIGEDSTHVNIPMWEKMDPVLAHAPVDVNCQIGEDRIFENILPPPEVDPKALPPAAPFEEEKSYDDWKSKSTSLAESFAQFSTGKPLSWNARTQAQLRRFEQDMHEIEESTYIQ